MTDLLDSLVDRALDRAPVLQRRQPTLFEPVAEPAIGERSQFGSLASLHEEETVAEGESSPGRRESAFITNPARLARPSPPPEEPRRRYAESLPTRPRDNPEINPFPENDRDTRRRESAGPAPVAESDASAIGREEPPSGALTHQVVARPQEITVAPQHLIETIVERRVEREIISEQAKYAQPINDAHPLAGPLKGPRERSGDVDREQVKQPFKVETKQLSHSKEETPTKPLMPKKPAPRREGAPVARAVARAESARAPQQPTPPTIHVTIGRIEVRATPLATERAQTVRPTGPKLSLEDYLRSRGEGN